MVRPGAVNALTALVDQARSETSVVFSFFKKDPKDNRSAKGGGPARGPVKARPAARPVGRAMPEPANRSSSAPSGKFATTENALPDRELARSLAMETAAKIDAIESEMARDFLRPAANTLAGAPSTASGRATSGRTTVAPPKVDTEAKRPDTFSDDDGLDGPVDIFLGNADAIELHTSGAGSVIDETAILFANGQDADAEATLRTGIDADTLGASLQNGWLMLFELVNQRGDRAAFEQLTMQYALRFENSPPAWVDYAPTVYDGGAPVLSAAPVVKLPDVIDAQIVKPLEQLKALAAQHPALTLDASTTRSVDLVGAELVLRVINAFKRSSHELTLLGAEQLLVALRSAAEPGRRDSSDAAWMLLLEILRLLNRQMDFEETGIQYCVTFEVSPPSWEPAPPNLHTRTGAKAAAGAAVGGDIDPLLWQGVIVGEGEPHFGRLLTAAKNQRGLVIDCYRLRRMAFSAASALLSILMKLQVSGVSVELRQVNPLVGALCHLLGVTMAAQVHLRRN